MWIYRRISTINWCDHITNINVLERMNKDFEIVRTIKTQKLQYLGHVMAYPEKYRLLQLMVQGKIAGKYNSRRPQTSWMDNLRNWFNISIRYHIIQNSFDCKFLYAQYFTCCAIMCTDCIY